MLCWSGKRERERVMIDDFDKIYLFLEGEFDKIYVKRNLFEFLFFSFIIQKIKKLN